MAKPTIAQLTAQIEALRAANAAHVAKIEELRAFARKQQAQLRLQAEQLLGQRNKPNPKVRPVTKAAWQPSAQMAAAKAAAMASGKAVKVVAAPVAQESVDDVPWI